MQPSTEYRSTTSASAPDLPPALLFGCGLTLVGVMRTLGRAAIPFYVVGSTKGFHTRSRWYRHLETDPFELRPEQLAGYLRELPLRRAVLMPCSDDWAQAVANLPTELQHRFPAPLPGSSALDTMTDKWRFAQFLSQHGIPHPATELLRSRHEAELVAVDRWRGKILKPISSVEFVWQHGVKGFLVGNPAEAIAALNKISFPILLQEYIPGPPTASFFLDAFVDRRGRMLACFARQRLRMHPDKLGNSTLMESIPLRRVQAAREILDRIIAAAAYRGILSAEFKYDYRDECYKIIEINSRPWWYIEFAARCGVDIPALAYRDALGMAVSPVESYQVGRRCVFLADDCRAYRHLRRSGTLNLWSWVKSWLRADDALFELSDPKPFLTLAMQTVRRAPRAPRQAPASLRAEAGHPREADTVLVK